MIVWWQCWRSDKGHGDEDGLCTKERKKERKKRTEGRVPRRAACRTFKLPTLGWVNSLEKAVIETGVREPFMVRLKKAVSATHALRKYLNEICHP